MAKKLSSETVLLQVFCISGFLESGFKRFLSKTCKIISKVVLQKHFTVNYFLKHILNRNTSPYFLWAWKLMLSFQISQFYKDNIFSLKKKKVLQANTAHNK